MDVRDLYDFEVYEDQEVWIERYYDTDERAEIPDSIDGLPVTRIVQHAFVTSEVVEITVPEGIKTIESEAFVMCENLQCISLPSSLKELGRNVFTGCEALGQVVFPNGNEKFFVEDGVLYNKEDQALILCPPGLSKEKFDVPPGIKVIAAGAFYQNNCLEYVHLPLTIEKIEEGAFLFTGQMRIIELPPFIKEIEPDSFLIGHGPNAEKPFEIYAFPDSVGYQYAVENHIPVHPLNAIVTD